MGKDIRWKWERVGLGGKPPAFGKAAHPVEDPAPEFACGEPVEPVEWVEKSHFLLLAFALLRFYVIEKTFLRISLMQFAIGC